MTQLPLQISVLLILFARIGAIVMALPIFTEDGLPMQLRLMMAIGLTLGLSGLVEGRIVAPATDGALIATIVAEVVIGTGIGLLVRIVFNAAAAAGAIASMQIGLSSVLVPDSLLGGQTPLLAHFLSVAALISCMAMGVHHLWIGAILHSYDQFPVGVLPPSRDLVHAAIFATTRATELSLSLAAPLIVYAMVFNTALGLAARLTPNLQVFFVSQPLNVLFGLTLFAVTLGVVLTGFSRAMIAFLRDGLI